MEHESRRPDRIFVVSISSAREIDLVGRRIRRLEGVNPATPREGDREWRPFLDFAPNPPVPAMSLSIAWGFDAATARLTQTGPTVWAGIENPTRGPFSWAGEGDDGTSPGFVLVGGESIATRTPAAAHVLAGLGNVGTAYRGFSSPEPAWELLPVSHDGVAEVPEGHVILSSGGAGLAVGPADAVTALYEALRRLPPDVHLAMSVFAAATPGAVWSTAPLIELDARQQRRALVSSGLTDEEIDSVSELQSLVAATTELAELMTWGGVGRWLRSPHPALDGASPLEVLAHAGDVSAAVAEPFCGGDPPESDWEPEAWACYHAAKSAWDWVDLLRTRIDGRWFVRGSRKGVRVGVSDSLYGIMAVADIADDADSLKSAVVFEGLSPTDAPVELARRVDEWLALPGNPELALVRAIDRVASHA